MGKIKIRFDCFETNSSSSHSIVFQHGQVDETELIRRFQKSDDGYLHITFGEFGWEEDRYTDPISKLEYAATMVAETEKYWSEESFYETDGIKLINDFLKEEIPGCKGIKINKSGINKNRYGYLNHNGYIDHQSSSDCYSSLRDFLEKNNLTLEQFVCDWSVILKTGNDNH